MGEAIICPVIRVDDDDVNYLIGVVADTYGISDSEAFNHIEEVILPTFFEGMSKLLEVGEDDRLDEAADEVYSLGYYLVDDCFEADIDVSSVRRAIVDYINNKFIGEVDNFYLLEVIQAFAMGISARQTELDLYAEI